MKSKLSVFAILSIALLLISTGAVFAPPVSQKNADAMWIDPLSFTWNTATTSIGYTFNITVSMNITSDKQVFAYQIGLKYPRSFLQCNKAGYTAGATSEFFVGKTTSSPPPVIDVSSLGNGSILGFETLLGTDFRLGWAATLMWAEFTIVAAPPKNGTLTGSFNLSGQTPSDNWVEDSSLNGIQITAYDSPITYTWSKPTMPAFMGIEGPSAWPLVYGPNPPNVTGQTFIAKVYVDNIDPAWYLNNVTFTLTWNTTVIDVVGGVANRTLDPAWSVISESLAGGAWSFVANYTGTQGISTKLLVATLTFTIMMQAGNPPQTTADKSLLKFSNVAFWDHTISIDQGTDQQGEVDVLPLITLKMPWLYVDPAVTYVGPAPSIGDIICVNVDVKNLTKTWRTVAIEFRLQYDDTLLQLMSVSEGPFMQNPVWDKYGTFFTSIDNVGGDFTYPFTHVLVLDLLYPNTTTGLYDQTTFPNAPQTPTPETPGVNPAVATFCFKVLQQNCFGGANITTALNILPFWPPTDNNFIDADANFIPDLPGVNGTVVIQALNFVGRQIDLYGGAVNDGYGVLVGSPYLQFPTPYGGQGPNHWMDIVFPQSQVFLNANVTYNYWPVQSKDVGWEIEGPFTKLPNGTLVPAQTYQIWAKFSSITDSNGVATYTYRMPWPCVNPDGITGIWKITATATVADQEIMDTTIFYYQRVVYITSVTTEFPSYYHDVCVKVTVNYQTHSVASYPALFSIVLTDELGVPFGMALYSTTVGGATFCTWKNSTFNVCVYIPKWAYAGNGAVHVAVYDKDPTIGGQPWQSEYKPDPIINIYPY